MKTIQAILTGIGIWIFGILAFLLSSSISILNDPKMQGNLVLDLALIPIVTIGTKYYFKKYKNANPFQIGWIFFATVFALDALITVPFFMKPYGIHHIDFFLDAPFWFIAIEFYVIVVVTGKLITKTQH